MRIDDLTDKELTAINSRHGWVCGTADSKGRILGNKGRVYDIPERRVVMAQDSLGLAGKTVVEFGCLEGCHTVALARQAKSVFALDFQANNIEKSRIRTELYDAKAEFAVMDVETDQPPEADLYFHSGVLYHLTDPASHLLRMAPRAKEFFLDTHHTRAPNEQYVAIHDAKAYPFRKYGEPSHPRAGSGGFSRWTTLEVILSILKQFYAKVVIIRDEDERNGARVTIAATKRK